MDPFAVAVLIAVGLWPLWAAVRADSGLGAGRVVLAALAAAVTVGMTSLAVGAPVPDSEPPADRPLQGRTPDPDVVTSDVCRACHPHEDATWRASFHRTMTQVATPEAVVPDIDEQVFEHRGDRYRLVRRGDRYYAGIAVRTPAGEDWVEREVVQTTGSHHFQSYWFATGEGRELTMFPLCYRIDEERWMPVDAAFLMPPGTQQQLGSARWSTSCIVCHTTWGQPRLAEGHVDTHVGEFGIACEACHGPAGPHVAANRDPMRRYGLHLGDGNDPTVANPARMDPVRSAEVCGQCHGVTVPRQELAAQWLERGHTYRAGDVLADTRVLVAPENAGAPELARQLAQQPDFFDTIFWKDGQVRISGRDYHGLLASPCYAEGEGEHKMTCLSCHQMHQAADDPRPRSEWADDQLGPGMRTDRACTQCHEELGSPAAAAAHSRHPEGTTSCYDCHMPYTTFGLLKAIRSHTVGSPSAQESVDVGRPNACNLCHLDRSIGWTAEQLSAGWGVDAPDLSADAESREIAAGVLWALRGDAGVRAIVAAAFGRAEARAASGTEWMLPYTAELLRDPYDAVRFVAQAALRAEDGVGPTSGGYDFLAPEPERRAFLQRFEDGWRQRRSARQGRDLTAVLVDAEGNLRTEAYAVLLAARDLRRIYLGE
jgi:hypothetical protein